MYLKSRIDVLHNTQLGNNDGRYPMSDLRVIGHHPPPILPEIGPTLPPDPRMPPLAGQPGPLGNGGLGDIATSGGGGSTSWIPETDKPYMCSNCGKGYTHIFTLNRHRRTVCGKIRNTSGKWKCPRCNRSYVTEGNLVRHVRFECGVRRKFCCIFCNSKFTQRCSLIRHLRNFHKESFDGANSVAGADFPTTPEAVTGHYEGKSSDDSRI